jgi:endo-1,3-1,4-beta-glycanase ExoK
MRKLTKSLAFFVTLSCAGSAWATSSAELYTAESYGYGRFEARMMFAPGDGVVSSMFLWKNGSELSGAFWNELDYEKIGADCRMDSNAIYGKPMGNHNLAVTQAIDFCGGFHTYAYEWTPDAIVWLIDGVEVRRETGAIAKAYADNASTDGMTFHFNLWPGDESFGGHFSTSILPVHQYIDWVQYSAYKSGAFSVSWREDFDGATLPANMLTATWASPKNNSTNTAKNVNFVSGYAVLSLTSDNATGPAGAKLPDAGTSGGADASRSDGGSGVNDASSGASEAGRGDAAGSSDASGGAVDSSATGAGGAAGAGNIGTGGAAGTSNTGTGGTAGAGNTGTGGAAGAGNTTGTGGTAGTSNTGTGGAGSNNAGKDSGAAGATGGTNNNNNAGGASNAPAPSSGGGCSVAAGKVQSRLLAPFALLALALLGRGARRRERRSVGLGRSA